MMNAENYCSVTVFILASNETESLRETVSQIRLLKHIDNIKHIIIVAKRKDSPCVAEAEKIISESNDGKVTLYIQKGPSIENCIQELPSLVKTSHFVIMSADMEMHPSSIDVFIEKATEHPERIICASKFHKDSTRIGYKKHRKVLALAVETFINLLFGTNCTDIFTLYKIYPVSVLKKLNLPTDINFGYQYITKALRNGVEYEEIPTVFSPRTDGCTNFNTSLLIYIVARYLVTAVVIRFSPKEEAFKNKGKTGASK